MNPDRRAELLSKRLENALDQRTTAGSKRPLLWALYDTFRFEFILGGVCRLLASLLMVFTPYLTRYLIAFATDAYVAQHSGQPAPHIGRGIGFVLGITIMQALQNMTNSHFMYHGQMVGGQIRTVLIPLIFSKAMKISGRAKAGSAQSPEELKKVKQLTAAKDQALKQPGAHPTDGKGWGNGRIVSLMSIDVDRINLACGMFHMVWAAPVSIIVTLVLLLVNLGYSALAGYALIVVGIPFLTYAARFLFKMRGGINKMTDQRVSLTQEILQGVRFVKFFGWESSFLDRLKQIRRREIRSVQTLLAVRNGMLCISMVIPVFASMLSFITYALSNHSLDPAPIFSSLALFNSLRLPLNLLPMVIGQITDAWTALNRIQEFIAAEEQKDDIQRDEDMFEAVKMDGACFTWERMAADKEAEQVEKKADLEKRNQELAGNRTAESGEPFQLRDMTLDIQRDELIAVIGTVGCGKSSLLSALAGDMRLTDGAARLSTSRAFCPQYTWVQNASLRSNILFGRDYDKEWYDQVIEACALDPDLEILPNGDMTEIGERGITISGGQKQRLNIARAIYFNAGLVLLDDPLSAVDAHVGRHIMDKAICGLLKGRCRILATHQLHVLSRCDRIVVMDEGRIQSVGTFDELSRDNEVFKTLLSTASQDTKVGAEEAAAEVEEDTEKQVAQKPAKPAPALMQQEEKATDSVGWAVWKAYIRASGRFGYLNAVAILFLLALSNVISVWTNLWLSYWTSDHYPSLSTGQYVGIYAALGAATAISMFAFSTYMTTAGTNSSRTMLQLAMTRVLRAPMSFFDTTPLGRITNRFSKDIQVMDSELCDAMRMYSITITMIISVMILIIVFYYYFAIALAVLFVLFLVSSNYYRASARELKRHESILRSTVYARFSEAITGAASIRAYGVQDEFRDSLRSSIDLMNGAYFLTFSNQRWLSTRLDTLAMLLVFVTGILVVTSRFDVSPSISGLVLSYILAIAQMIQFTVRQLAEVENNMNATERLHYYGTQLDEEAPLHTSTQVPPTWPQTGQITFSNVAMRYRANLPLVLKNLSMNITGGERIGIVGRTGAGKSSIMSALFRLTELSAGTITIDDMDIAKIGLQDLRSRLAIIPQDPTLFRGSIRSNLDPFNEHTDLELWDALRQAHLVDTPTTPASNSNSNPDPDLDLDPEIENAGVGAGTGTGTGTKLTLDTAVDDEGLTFSLGQRQLMALARALVRNARIIICDEATSSVDFATDQRIQETMARGFQGKTLLCIAHRLRTIIHYDRICVMDQGSIAEMDSPLRLWDKEDGIFRAMCERSGISREDILGEELE